MKAGSCLMMLLAGLLLVRPGLADGNKPYSVVETKDRWDERFRRDSLHTLPRQRSSPGPSNEWIEDSPAIRIRANAIIDALRARNYQAFLAAADGEGASAANRFTESIFYEMAAIFEVWATQPVRIMTGRPYRHRQDQIGRYSQWIYFSTADFRYGTDESAAINLSYDGKTQVLRSVWLRPNDGYRSFRLPEPDPSLELDPVRDIEAVR